jgi:hypothetical protein
MMAQVANPDDLNAGLMAGERMLWSGRPRTGLLLTGRDIFLIPFSLFWCGCLGFWTLGPGAAGGLVFDRFSLALLTFGVALTFGRFPLDAWLRSRTRYTVTDRRVLTQRAGPLSNFTAVALDRLPDVRLKARRNGWGDIQFGQSQPLWGFGRTGLSVWLPSLDATPQFLAIPDARKVFDLIQQVSHQAG